MSIYQDLDKLYEKIEKIENENKKLHSIIKEVREYIEEVDFYTNGNTKPLSETGYGRKLLEILDKGE